MTLEALIDEVDSHGLYFNNLMQVDAGIWRCNLRHKGTNVCHAWSRGKTAAEAIDGALRVHRANSTKPPPKLDVEIVAAAEVAAAGGLFD